MKSHVQIPKSILKNFSYRDKNNVKVVDYLDLRDNQIKTEKIRVLDTIENYYSKECEKFLSENIEGPFGDISKKIRDFLNEKIDELTPSQNEFYAVFNFFEYSMKRSEMALMEVNKYSLTSVISPITHDEIILNSSARFFTDYFMTFITNKTETKFVIPRNCIYLKNSLVKDRYQYILPFSPNAAIILLPNEEKMEYITEDKKRRIFHINDKDVVKKMNDIAFYTEINMNNQFLVGDKTELLRLKNKL